MDNEQQLLMLKAKLNMLTKEHSDLDALVKEMVSSNVCDLLSLQRRKKRKLSLKDEINAIKQMITPDILA